MVPRLEFSARLFDAQSRITKEFCVMLSADYFLSSVPQYLNRQAYTCRSAQLLMQQDEVEEQQLDRIIQEAEEHLTTEIELSLIHI